MGAGPAKPYIIDEFGSDDDDDEAYQSAFETAPEPPIEPAIEPAVSTQAITWSTVGHPPHAQEVLWKEDYREKMPGKELMIGNFGSRLGFEELLMLIENHDLDGAKRVAALLKAKEAAGFGYRAHGGESATQLLKSEVSSEVTSTWPSTTTQEEVTEKLSCILQQHNDNAGDFKYDDDLDQRKSLSILDDELLQFEANEQKISHETPVLHSGIPRLMPGSLRSGRSLTLSSSSSAKSVVDRKRSPSPHGSRPSGIPRYSYAHVAPASAGAAEAQTLEATSLSNTLDSLPEFSDRKQSSTSMSHCTSPSSGSGNHCLSTKETISDPSIWDVNVSNLTGRVKMIKKHSCLPSLWVKTDGPRLTRAPNQNLSQISSSMSSDMATADIAACRAIRECGALSERKVLDLRRWYCISRPQYKTSCGISAVVSCWNYLFSTMGHGRLPPVTQETAMKLLGFTSPFDSINFGPVTGNLTVLRWFNELNAHFNVSGHSFVMFKPSGKSQTANVTDQMALEALKKGLKDPKTAFIYHCHNHYFCPIGYEDTSQFCVDAYKRDIGGNEDSWVFFGDTSRKHPPIYCQSWEKICLDLNCKSPSYYNIRQGWKGVIQRKNITAIGDNLHCIMTFQKSDEQLQISPMSLTSASSNSSGWSMSHSSRHLSRPNNSSGSPVRLSGMKSAVDTQRPELGDHFPARLEEAEVGCENLESDNSEDDVERMDVNGAESEVAKSELAERKVNESEVNGIEARESDVNRSSANGSETKESEVEKSEVNGIDATVSEVKESEVEKSEVNEIDAMVSEVKESEVEKSEVNGSEANETEVDGSEVKESGVNESELTESEEDKEESENES